jgi:vitamin B12 transporter
MQTSMTQPNSRSRVARLSFSIALGLGALASVARAQDARADSSAVTLDNYVISASRTAQDPRYTPSSVTELPLSELATVQITDLRTALGREPGVIVSTAGGVGGLTSVFIRGANNHHTLFVVDGVRMNDRSTTYNNFLGGADLAGLDRIEVLRGPQSTLYGSSALGGVIALSTTQGCAPTAGTIALTAGSFETLGASAAVQGGSRKIGYSASVARYQTANDEPHNDFEQWSYATRLEFAPTDTVLAGATFRGQNSDFDQNGSRYFVSPGNAASNNYLSTVYGQVRAGEGFKSRLTAALHRRSYDWTDLSGSPWAVNSALNNAREILDWQNTWAPSTRVEVVAGANHERSRYDVDGVRSRDQVIAGYLSGTAHPVKNVTVTAGVRHDDFDSVGEATTWRSGVSWRPAANTKLRTTYGTGFSAPGSDDRYGVASWGQLPNPNLRPEKSRGWDVGIDQTLPSGNATVSATYFQNRFRDLFEWETVDFVTFQGRTANVARAKTEGMEIAVSASLGEAVETRVSYTYLEAHDTTTGARLIRRPRHSGDAEVRVRASQAWLIGAGLRVGADRTETVGPFESYTTVRVFTSYALRPELIVKLRVENALDEAYDDVRGYAALPRGVFGGIEWSF